MENSQRKQPIILWVDDDPDERTLMREVLHNIDTEAQLEEADNGRDALQYLDTAKQNGSLPCLIVLDLNMPVLNGKETLARVKADPHYKYIRVVVFTTSNSPLDQEFCAQYDTPMLTKPITSAGLRHVVKQLLQICEESAEAQ